MVALLGQIDLRLTRSVLAGAHPLELLLALGLLLATMLTKAYC